MTHLYIHCGLHKTGSTSIQIALKKAVPAENLVVPVEGATSSLERLRSAKPNKVCPLFVSDENLLGQPFLGYADLPHRVKLLNENLTSPPGKVIVYVRHQLDWLESLFTQSIQQGSGQDAESFAERVMSSPWIDWPLMQEELSKSFGRDAIQFRPYYPQVDVVSDFLHVVGLREAKIRRARRTRINSSLTPGQAMLMLRVNRMGLLDEAQTQLARRRLQVQSESGKQVSTSIFPEDLQEKILKMYEESWTKVALFQVHQKGDRTPQRVASPRVRVRPFVGNEAYVARMSDDELMQLATEWCSNQMDPDWGLPKWRKALQRRG